MGGADASRPLRRAAPPADGAEESDFAAELDDRIRLRQLFEALRGRLSAREREAAALCYLQGLSRSQAAARMGISEARMRKLMDGQGAGRPGVAHKVGALADTIQAGGWCEEQASLMRGLAYGILDPAGERYRLALIHRAECPACRAYVLSLRGLAAVLPPVLLPWGLGAGVLTRAGLATHERAGIGAHPTGAGQASAGAGGQASAGIGGALSASGAAGAGGAAGGSWLWAGGSLGAKVAVGCLLALGVGAGCVAFTDGPRSPVGPVHRRASSGIRAGGPERYYDAAAESLRTYRLPERGPFGEQANASDRAAAQSALTPAEQAAREFGLERGAAAAETRSASPAGRKSSAARSATSGSAPSTAAEPPSEGSASGPAQTSPPSRSPAQAPAGGRSAAEREFGIE